MKVLVLAFHERGRASTYKSLFFVGGGEGVAGSWWKLRIVPASAIRTCKNSYTVSRITNHQSPNNTPWGIVSLVVVVVVRVS